MVVTTFFGGGREKSMADWKQLGENEVSICCFVTLRSAPTWPKKNRKPNIFSIAFEITARLQSQPFWFLHFFLEFFSVVLLSFCESFSIDFQLIFNWFWSGIQLCNRFYFCLRVRIGRGEERKRKMADFPHLFSLVFNNERVDPSARKKKPISINLRSFTSAQLKCNSTETNSNHKCMARLSITFPMSRQHGALLHLWASRFIPMILFFSSRLHLPATLHFISRPWAEWMKLAINVTAIIITHFSLFLFAFQRYWTVIFWPIQWIWQRSIAWLSQPTWDAHATSREALC